MRMPWPSSASTTLSSAFRRRRCTHSLNCYRSRSDLTAARGTSTRVELGVKIELAAITDHALEIQSQCSQHRLGDWFYLLHHVVLAIERVANVVERLGARRRHDVADRSRKRLGGFARRDHMRWGSCGVFLGVLAQILAIHQRRIELAASHPPHHVREICVDGLIGEQTLIELALYQLCQRRPIPAHDFHADELDAVRLRTAEQACIALAGAARAVARARQE